MGTLQTYWEMSQLAQASYVDLTGVAIEAVRADLQEPSPQEFYRFSGTQAARLIDDFTGFSVADRNANLNDAVGFSATLFKDNRLDGQYTLALRGTENNTIANIDWITSVGHISVAGIAFQQIVSMYNYVQRLITQQNELVRQVSLQELIAPPTDGRPFIQVQTGGYLAKRNNGVRSSKVAFT